MTLQSACTFRGMISIVEERAAESPPPSCFRYGKGKYHIPAAVTHNTVPGKKGRGILRSQESTTFFRSGLPNRRASSRVPAMRSAHNRRSLASFSGITKTRHREERSLLKRGVDLCAADPTVRELKSDRRRGHLPAASAPGRECLSDDGRLFPLISRCGS